MSNSREGEGGTTATTSGVEDPKEAAIRALLFASPSPSPRRALNSSTSGGNTNSVNVGNGNTPSSLSLSASAVQTNSPSSDSVPTNSLRVRTELPIPSDRRNSVDHSNSSTPTQTPNLTPTSNGPTTARHVSPPKWSQRHLHHHLPSANPSSPAISPALTPVPSSSSGLLSPVIISPVHSASLSAVQMGVDREKDKGKEKGKGEGENVRSEHGGGITDRRKLSSKNLLEVYGDEETLRQKLLLLKDKRKKSNSTTAQVDQMLSASMEDLNITGEDINFDELESFLKESQEDHSVKEALTQGVELKEYGQKVDDELKSNENAIVPIYIEMRNEIGEMHSKVGGCIDILSAFEKLLTSFQGDLSNISDDIKNMQDQSMEKNIKINNRKAVISKVERFIDDVSLPPSYVEQLEKAQIDMSYLQLLASFNRKLGFISLQRAKGAIAIEDMYRKFNVTLDKVIARVHKYVVHQTATIKSFAQLRDTQLELGSMSFLYQFLFIHAPDNARDVKAAYMDTCDKFYTNYYKSYVNSMSKYLFDVATKNDVIGMEDSKLRGFFSSKMTKSNIKASVFSLGTRLNLIETDAPPIDATTSSNATTQPKYSYEELFRTQLKLLVDQVNSEFFFVRDFFLSNDDVTFGIFPRCADLLVENVENYIANSYDAIGLLVVMCLINRFTELIPENLDYLLTSLKKATHSIFNRFGFILEMNMASIRHANPQDLGPIDIRTHYVTRRYAEFSASILTLYGTLPDPLRDAISSLLSKIRDLMLKLLRQLSLELKDKKEQTVFLINNYDLVLSLVQTRGVNAEEVADFTSALTQAENSFVSLQLSDTPHVAQIASFVEDISPLLNKTGNEDHVNHPKYNKDVAEALLKQFSHQWREGIKAWYADVLKLFTNFNISKLLFQKVADQMFSYYKQFTTIIGRSFKALKTSKFLIPETEIVRELHEYNDKLSKYTG